MRTRNFLRWLRTGIRPCPLRPDQPRCQVLEDDGACTWVGRPVVIGTRLGIKSTLYLCHVHKRMVNASAHDGKLETCDMCKTGVLVSDGAEKTMREHQLFFCDGRPPLAGVTILFPGDHLDDVEESRRVENGE